MALSHAVEYGIGGGATVVAAAIAYAIARRRARVAPPAKEAAEERPPVARPPGKAPPEVVAPPPLVAVPPPAPAPPVPRRDEALRQGLAKTRGGFIARIGDLFQGRREIDAALLAELEDVLLTADIGVKTSKKLFTELKQSLDRRELAEPGAVWRFIRDESVRLLALDAPPLDVERARPFVILVIGVNGVGKTTTIGKLAAQLTRGGKKVLLAAGDTFRAAATEQLEIWGQRSGAPVVKGAEKADPASVAFNAARRAQDEGFDVLIVDTAGRLHTKTELMEELGKVRRTIGKALPGAPHETLLVLDSTNGQNAIAQARIFMEAISITGIILTKLDGTAKGGVILGICDELKVPVRYVGVGEKVEDLREFRPEEFVAALYDRGEESAA